MEFSLTLTGQTPSKKNSHIIFRHGSRMQVAPNSDYRKWEERAAMELNIQRLNQQFDTLTNPLCLSAKVRFKFVPGRGQPPDLLNLLESIADALQVATVIKNDRQIVSLDGSRLVLIQSGEPGVDIELVETDKGGMAI